MLNCVHAERRGPFIHNKCLLTVLAVKYNSNNNYYWTNRKTQLVGDLIGGLLQDDARHAYKNPFKFVDKLYCLGFICETLPLPTASTPTTPFYCTSDTRRSPSTARVQSNLLLYSLALYSERACLGGWNGSYGRHPDFGDQQRWMIERFISPPADPDQKATKVIYRFIAACMWVRWGILNVHIYALHTDRTLIFMLQFTFLITWIKCEEKKIKCIWISRAE